MSDINIREENIGESKNENIREENIGESKNENIREENIGESKNENIREENIGESKNENIREENIGESKNENIREENIGESKNENIREENIGESKVNHFLTVAVAESVTAGAVSNILCSDPGSSTFFYGGIVAYNMISQKNLLDVDEKYAEQNGFANPFTTLTMAKNVSRKFNSRIGISNTGFSLPTYRKEECVGDYIKCEINVKIPFAYICIYDSFFDYHKIYLIKYTDYCIDKNQKKQRALMQVLVSKKTKEIFIDYCNKKK